MEGEQRTVLRLVLQAVSLSRTCPGTKEQVGSVALSALPLGCMREPSNRDKVKL